MYSIMVQVRKTLCFAKPLRYSSKASVYITVVAGHLFSLNEIRYMILIGWLN